MPTPLSPSRHVRRIPLDGGLVLLDLAADALLTFNETALRAWQMVEGGADIGAIADAFVRAWGIDPARARADVEAVVGTWRARGLLEGSGAPRPPDPAPSRAAPHAIEGARASTWICTVRGAAFSITAEGDGLPPLRDFLRQVETPGAAPAARIEVRRDASGGYALARDGADRLRGVDAAGLVGGLWQAVLEIAHPGLRWLAAVHGAALARRGGGLVLAAPSGSGKSTLAAGLMARGFEFLADDLAALAAPDGALLPWPLPLSIKSGSLEALAALHPGLADRPTYPAKGWEARLLAPAPAAWRADPVPVRRLLFPLYRAGAPPAARRLGPFEALQRLLDDRVWLGHPMTEEGAAAFVAWLGRTPCHALEYGSLDAGLALVGELDA